MPAQTPEDLQKLFADAINAGDMERLLELYEEHAAFITGPGQFVAGRPAIRDAMANLIALKPRYRIEESVVIDDGTDFALMQVRWVMEGTAPDGKPVKFSGTSRELVRPQPDGRWLYAIDDRGFQN
jgi:uncharacterized protein (TIGR02246 family)